MRLQAVLQLLTTSQCCQRHRPRLQASRAAAGVPELVQVLALLVLIMNLEVRRQCSHQVAHTGEICFLCDAAVCSDDLFLSR